MICRSSGRYSEMSQPVTLRVFSMTLFLALVSNSLRRGRCVDSLTLCCPQTRQLPSSQACRTGAAGPPVLEIDLQAALRCRKDTLSRFGQY